MNCSVSICWLIILLLPFVGYAQIAEDRPKVVEKKTLSPEEAKRQNAEELIRNAKTLYGLGVYRERTDRILDALKLLEEARKIDPDSIAIPKILIPIYQFLGRDEEALEASKKVLSSDPNDYEVAFKQALIFKMLGKKRESLESLLLALKSNRLTDRPEKELLVLLELCSQANQASDLLVEKRALLQVTQIVSEKRNDLILSAEFKPEELTKYSIEAYEKLGRCYVQLKQNDKALESFQKAYGMLKSQGDEQSLRAANRLNWNLCELASAQEKWQEALKYLNIYIEQQPGSIEPYEQKLTLLRKLNRTKEIIPTARSFAQKEPHHIGIKLLLARELSQTPDTQEEAERIYTELLGSYTKPEIYQGLFKLHQLRGKTNLILNMLDQIFEISTDKTKELSAREQAAEQWNAILSALREEKTLVLDLIKTATQELGRIRNLPQRKSQTWELLASLAASTRQLDKAEKFYRKCLETGNLINSDSIYDGLLEVLRMQRKWKEVISICKELIGNSGIRAYQYHYQLALAYSQLEEFDRALAETEQVIKLIPRDDKYKYSPELLKVRILSQANRHEQAIAECERLMKGFPVAKEKHHIRVVLAAAYLAAGDQPKSEEQLQIIIDENPEDALACNNLGYQWAERNVKLDEAEKLIRRAIDLQRKDPFQREKDNAAYLDSLGWVLYRKKDYDEALKWLEKAVALPSGAEDGTVWDHLGDVYIKLDNLTKAKEAWEKALELFQGDLRAKRDGHLDDAKRKLKLVQSK
jgi:tetratricopeptide (TPR) repeat protein